MEIYQLDKAIWDGGDFAGMGWHDATVWSMFADTEAFEFVLDLDYIFKWVPPNSGETHFRFWVAPVTMVFENAHTIRIEIESQQGHIEIADLQCLDPTLTPNGKFTQHTYRFECQQGEIALQATGYKMFVRRPPMLIDRQTFGLKGRNGVGFGRELIAT